MGRNAFVTGVPVRLQLADVYRRAHARLMEQGIRIAKADEEAGKPERWRKATAEEISDSADALSAAVEDAYWIEVKPQLTAGETRKAAAKLAKDAHFNERALVDFEQVGWSKVVAYMLGWNLCDESGAVIPYGLDAMDNLRPAIYGAIEAAVDWHEDEVIKAQVARKNVQGDETKSSTTSSSVA